MRFLSDPDLAAQIAELQQHYDALLRIASPAAEAAQRAFAEALTAAVAEQQRRASVDFQQTTN
ncbi:MAG: hypothetical protein HY661_02485 [Betaproteobacteria bacterium]|nr:hypothetical protein [Betaproteobacteria bacterium]